MTDKQAIDHKVIFCNFDVTAGYEFTRDIEFISESTPAPGVGGGTPASTIVEAQAAYAYSPTHGRIAQVAKSPNQTFYYAYTLNSNLLATVSGPIHTVTNHWEPDHDHLDLKQNKVGSSVISGHDCAVNAIGQRTGIATSNRAYQYDAIGNRQKTANSLTLPAAKTTLRTHLTNTPLFNNVTQVFRLFSRKPASGLLTPAINSLIASQPSP